MPVPPRFHVARYRVDGNHFIGRVDGDRLVRLSAPPWEGGVETGPRDRLAEVRLEAPVRPGKIVCVGLNYRAHIAESLSVSPGAEPPSEPLLFLKPPSAVLDPEDSIRYPAGVTRLDPEAELAVVMGHRARRIRRENAMAHVAGFTAFNDVSARNLQKQDGQWTRAKGFDTFAPLGPWITVGLPADRLDVVCRVNGETRQHGNTADLSFPVDLLVSFISHVMTLEPGDVIATGTPAGIAPIQIGDVVEVEVEGVGVLRNPVAAGEA
jgi:2-keto-4-pentenoate hydratase/2-oxohepta-3-ene-1,7-dioic acid hydratase in catechol pathway